MYNDVSHGMPSSRLQLTLLFAGVVAIAAGCSRGPRMLESTRGDYNKAVHVSSQEQILLNLVRLRHGESPLFLEVGGITAQFQYVSTAVFGTTLNENVGVDPLKADAYTATGTLSFSDTPTITFTPLQDGKFAMNMLTPLDEKVLVLLLNSQWKLGDVLRICVKRMKTLRNGFGEANDDFEDAARLLNAFNDKGLVDIAFVTEYTPVSGEVVIAEPTAKDLVKAAAEGYSFGKPDSKWVMLLKTAEDCKDCVSEASPKTKDVISAAAAAGYSFKRERDKFTLCKKEHAEEDVQVSKDVLQATATELKTAAGAAGFSFRKLGREGFTLRKKTRTLRLTVKNVPGNLLMDLKCLGKHLGIEVTKSIASPVSAEAAEPEDQWNLVAQIRLTQQILPAPSGLSVGDLDIKTRSLLEIMVYLSQGVDFPGFQSEMSDTRLITIRQSDEKPDGAARSVLYEKHWFYIEATDRTSKETLQLLTSLIAIQSGELRTKAPVLTLPVGG